MKANGLGDLSGNGRSGAGGSIWITAGSVSGTGTIEARGGDSSNGWSGGGGGAIAIEYSGAASGTVLSTLLARGGDGSGSNDGGAGTIVVKGPGSVFGDLFIDNKSLGKWTTDLPGLGFGFAAAGTSDATLVTDRASNIPNYFVGHWVEVRDASNAVKGVWRIASIDATNLKKVTLAPNGGETISVQPGDAWRGIYRFDHAAITNVTLSTLDRLDSTSAIQLLSGSNILGNNQGPPAVDSSKISIANGALGPALIGTAGAVADTDQPITVFAQNQTSGQTFPGVTAAADGSFTIPLRGSTGDSIYVFAKDSNTFPMQGQPLLAGTLPAANITPVAIPFNSSMTNNDGNFRARRLAYDGNTLVAQNYPASTDTNKLLVFDLSTGTPTWTQTISVPNNTRDVAVRNNVAYVASPWLWVYDLSTNPATRTAQVQTDCGDAWSVAVDGTYAYVGGGCGDGHIAIYDVTNPKVPAFIRSQGTGMSSVAYTQIVPSGRYLFAVSPNGNTHDVVVIDRTNPNSLVKVVDKDIPSFTAFRASLQGTTLYVNGLEGSVAIVDVSVPTAPVVKSVFSTGTSAHGIAAIGTLAFHASDGNGVIGIDAGDPANPRSAGGVPTSPQLAWDVVMRGQLGIIAAEDRLLTFGAGLPPQIDASKVTLGFDGHNATVQGTAFSVQGAAPLTVELRDETSNVKTTGVAVNTDGSFSGSVAAAAGDAISVVATDHNNLTSAVVRIGTVPFGSSTTLVPVTAGMANGDANFRARHIAVDGTTLAAVCYPEAFDSNKLLIFNIASGTPVFSQAISAPNNLRDVAVKDNVVFVASPWLWVYDLSTNPATPTASWSTAPTPTSAAAAATGTSPSTTSATPRRRCTSAIRGRERASPTPSSSRTATTSSASLRTAPRT
jgi:hypothetical protein